MSAQQAERPVVDHAHAEYLLRFQHLESIVGADPHLFADRDAIASLRGLSRREYDALRGGLSDRAAGVAAELAASMPAQIDALPWRGGTLAIAGDSITADLQSWARIVEVAMIGRPAHADSQVLNFAIDGDTSTGLLSRLPGILACRPDHVLIMIASNDGQGHAHDTVPWVSDSETERNLKAIGAELRDAGASVSWLAPPPLRVVDIASHWYLGELPIGWSAERHEAKRQIVLRQEGFAYDAAAAIGERREDFLDGLHPSLDGHRRLAKGVIEALAGMAE